MSRRETRDTSALLGSCLLVALFAHSCGPQLTPEQKTEMLRSQYTAELKSLTVKQDPVAGGGADTLGEIAADELAAADALHAPEASATGLEPAEAAKTEESDLAADRAAADAVETAALDASGAAAPAVHTDVILDILVSTTSQEYLPGLTLDVEHVDANRREKDRRTLWVETSGLVRGGGVQVTHVIENVDWEPGDGMFVEVRTPIPTEERAQYREFANP